MKNDESKRRFDRLIGLAKANPASGSPSALWREAALRAVKTSNMSEQERGAAYLVGAAKAICLLSIFAIGFLQFVFHQYSLELSGSAEWVLLDDPSWIWELV